MPDPTFAFIAVDEARQLIVRPELGSSGLRCVVATCEAA
jgi:hypothetical protein